MEESIKVQEEFENLIEQLERLKNINELTSANTESAKEVIKQIDSFVLSTNEYKKKIEEDLTMKNQSIDKLILHLEKSIDSIEHQSQSLSKSIESSFGIFKNETGESFTSLSEVVSEKIELAQKSIIDLKNSLLTKSANLESNLINSFSKQINALTEQVNETKNTLNITFLDKSNEQIVQLKTDFEKLMEVSKKQSEQTILRLDNQNKQIKIVKTILFIICGLVIIGALATIFVLK